MPDNDTVGVVIVGTLFALSHADANVLKPRLLFKLVEGSILFHRDVDNGITSHAETWMQAYETTEIIFFKRAHFQKMWDEQKMQTNKQIIMASLQKNMFFHFINQQLKHHLIYETMVERVYKPGEVVALQSKRAYMNEGYRVFFENRPNKLRQEIENKKMTHEMNTGKKHTQIGSLMDVMRDNSSIRKLILATSPQKSSNRSHLHHRQRSNDDHYNDGDSDDHHRGGESKAIMDHSNQEIEATSSAILPQCKK